jgi:tetratricopeptide (TPR) repeat protein
MFYRILTIAPLTTFAVFSLSSAWSQPIQKSIAACEPIAQIISSGDPIYPPKTPLCKSDSIRPSTTVKAVCFLNQTVLTFNQGSISTLDKCVSLSPPRKCSNRASLKNCFNSKAPVSNQSEPTLISPYNDAVFSPTPRLTWHPVPGATSYTVQVRGTGVDWFQQVNETSLDYPQAQPKLALGNAYKVSIVANQDRNPISASSTVLIVASQDEIRQTKDLVSTIQHLKLLPDDEAIDLSTAYMSQGFLTEAISVLQARIQLGSQNPRIFRFLGDRFLDAGLPEQARQHYEKASALAQQIHNQSELGRAKDGIRQSQLLTQM